MAYRVSQKQERFTYKSLEVLVLPEETSGTQANPLLWQMNSNHDLLSSATVSSVFDGTQLKLERKKQTKLINCSPHSLGLAGFNVEAGTSVNSLVLPQKRHGLQNQIIPSFESTGLVSQHELLKRLDV